MLGTFPNAFSQAATSQWFYPVGNFPKVQIPKRQLSQSVLATSLSP